MTERDESTGCQLLSPHDADEFADLLEVHGLKVRQAIRLQIPPELRRWIHEDDVMQEAYTEAFLDRRRYSIRPGQNFRQWLFRIARNNLVDAVRGLTAEKRNVRRERHAVTRGGDVLADPMEWLADPGPSPSQAASREELSRVLCDALAELPASYRQVLLWYDLQACPIEAVAARQGCSVGAVFMRRGRALRMLQRIMSSLSHYF